MVRCFIRLVLGLFCFQNVIASNHGLSSTYLGSREGAYSLALDQGFENLSDEGNKITENSLYILNKMVQDKINDLSNKND